MASRSIAELLHSSCEETNQIDQQPNRITCLSALCVWKLGSRFVSEEGDLLVTYLAVDRLLLKNQSRFTRLLWPLWNAAIKIYRFPLLYLSFLESLLNTLIRN